MADDTQTPVAELSYEQARDELVRLVARIESGEAPLEESMVLWERGEELAAHCQARLDQAQARLDSVTGDPGGAQDGASATSTGRPEAPPTGPTATEGED
jgi:exodeoxyribonuclease VII small subunit